jgi:hypothetical protein
MITRKLPGFSFQEPKNRNVINIRISSARVIGETRPLRAIWTPELAQDVTAFHNIDAEAELTALLTQEIANQIDREIIHDLTNNNRAYNWTNINNILVNQGHQPIGELNHPTNDPFDTITFPLIRRIAARTIGMDLVTVQPLGAPTGLLHYIGGIDPVGYDNYIALPNEEGWYTDGEFQSLFIKISMKPHHFTTRRRTRRY